MSIPAQEAPSLAGTVAELANVTKHYRVRVPGRGHRTLQAVDGINLHVRTGKTLGLVGESGSGKSTIARLLLRLVDPTSGAVRLEGANITAARGATLRTLRTRMQMVFQDPYSSFDPLATISDSLAEALRIHGDFDRSGRQRRSRELLEMVGLSPQLLHRRPRELSGGQVQRIAIARALATKPALIALDEPVSSLDMSTQAQIINLLRRLQQELGIAYLFISHDLAVVRHVSHDIAIMYLGRLVETGPAEAVYQDPKHPYTKALLSAAPIPDPGRRDQPTRIVLTGDIPSPIAPPGGCRFHTRCPHAMPICKTTNPPLAKAHDTGTVSCHLINDAGHAAPATSGTGPAACLAGPPHPVNDELASGPDQWPIPDVTD